MYLLMKYNHLFFRSARQTWYKLCTWRSSHFISIDCLPFLFISWEFMSICIEMGLILFFYVRILVELNCKNDAYVYPCNCWIDIKAQVELSPLHPHQTRVSLFRWWLFPYYFLSCTLNMMYQFSSINIHAQYLS